jgi:CubicO group peptidase (beta-lactamase class C family)
MRGLVSATTTGKWRTPAAAELVEHLQRYVDDNIMAGVVILVADNKDILAFEALGHADIAARRPMRTDDLFWIASITKPVTAAALMMLVDENKLSVDDPVEKYIPGFNALKIAGEDGIPIAPKTMILVRHLLAHTGGLRFLNEKAPQIIDATPLKTSIEDNLLETLLFEPGTNYSYSNEGTDSIGRIIEIISGVPYETFLQERIFNPLGMTDTTFFPRPDQICRLAKSYSASDDQKSLQETRTVHLTYPLDSRGRFPSPGGGLFSTADDVLQFARMLSNGGALDGRRYLSSESVRQMTIKQTGPLITENYGFGLRSSDDGKTFGHGGALKTNMTVEQGLIRIFLTQQIEPWSSGEPDVDFEKEVRRIFKPLVLTGFPAPPVQ